MSKRLQENFEKRSTVSMEPLLRVTEAASILRVSPKTIHRLVRERKFSCVQATGGERRFTEEQVTELSYWRKNHAEGPESQQH